MWKENKNINIWLVIEIIIVAIIIFAVVKVLIDMSIYNKCFISPIDNNFNYNICQYYVRY